jgi:hypothetical protein
VGFGKVLEAERFAAGPDDDGPWTVTGPDGRLLAIYQRHKGTRAKPVLVIPAS